jgi:hypothetical protein
MDSINHMAYCLSRLRVTRHYTGPARQHLVSIRRLSEELNSNLTALDDIYTTSILEIKGHNILLLAHLLCYTGNDKAVDETLFTVSEKYRALYREWKQRNEGIDEQLNSLAAAVADTACFQEAMRVHRNQSN